MTLDDQPIPTQIPLFSLPLELLDQILSPLLRSFSCSGIVKCWLLGTDSYKDELLLTASRSSDILSLRLISRSFNTLITDILSYQKSRSLANFSGIYRVSSPRFMFTNCSRHLLQQGWGKDNDGSLESLVPILTFNSSVRVLELTCSQLQHLDHPEELFTQFPNLKQVVLDSHRAVRRNEDLLDDSETSIRSRRGLFDNELEGVRAVVGAFLDKKLRMVLRWFITHRHKCHAADKFTSVVISEVVAGRNRWDLKFLKRECVERRPLGVNARCGYRLTPGQWFHVRRLSEESSLPNEEVVKVENGVKENVEGVVQKFEVVEKQQETRESHA